MNQQQEIQQLRAELEQLRQRLEQVQRRLDALVGAGAPPLLRQPAAVPPPIAAPAAPPPPPAAVAAMPPVTVPPVLPGKGTMPSRPSTTTALPTESLELRLGTFWLPRLGMVLLLLGMVFFVTWSYRYMGAVGKVALSYACCIVLGGLGWWLERRMAGLARVLQAGALGLTYFVTYAAHYVDTFRVVHQPAVALGLLAVVVTGIVVVAERKRSATLAGLALFFGYLTTLSSGVAAFTLAANALLVVAALAFLARNRWVPLALGAVLATYVAYALWIWKASDWRELGRLIFEAGYLDAATFRLRATFLILYAVLFTVGALVVRREAMSVAERVGLVTLNHALFFVLFSLLLHHAYPAQQWVFQLLFGGVLLLLSVVAYPRYRPDRVLTDAMLLQGLAVATLGLINSLTGVSLVVVLALESLFLLGLAGAMKSRGVDWLGRATFALTAIYAWRGLPDWDMPLIVAAVCSAVIGMLCARQVKRLQPAPQTTVSAAALYFGLLAVGLLLTAVHELFGWSARPWGWLGAAVLVALVGGVLRTRETLWLANVPLAWAHLQFYLALGNWRYRHWTLDQALALVGLTLVFGLVVWGWQRARRDEASASGALLPYSLAAVAAMLAVTFDYCEGALLISVLALESAVVFAAGMWLSESALRGPSLLPLALSHLGFYLWRWQEWVVPLDHSLVLVAVSLGLGVLWRARERAESEAMLWLCGLAAVVVATVTTFDHGPRQWWLVLFALQALLLAASGLQQLVVMALVPVVAGVGSFYLSRVGALGGPWVAWTNVLGGLAALIAAEFLGRRQFVGAGWSVWVIVSVALLVLAAVAKLAAAGVLTVGWAVAGFVLLVLGFVARRRAYRLAGLGVLALAVVRAIGYDLAKVETVYRILSFGLLGILLLFLAFLYARNRDRLARWL